jgi:Domain of unknown function (DUF4062)
MQVIALAGVHFAHFRIAGLPEAAVVCGRGGAGGFCRWACDRGHERLPRRRPDPAHLYADLVRGCEVSVGVLGTRYGSPVPDKPEMSYTELEFDTATDADLPRLVFMLDTHADNVGIPVSANSSSTTCTEFHSMSGVLGHPQRFARIELGWLLRSGYDHLGVALEVLFARESGMLQSLLAIGFRIQTARIPVAALTPNLGGL